MRRKHSAATRAQYFYGNREIFLCAVIKIDLSISPSMKWTIAHLVLTVSLIIWASARIPQQLSMGAAYRRDNFYRELFEWVRI